MRGKEKLKNYKTKQNHDLSDISPVLYNNF